MRAISSLICSLMLPCAILGGTFFLAHNPMLLPQPVEGIVPALPFVLAISGGAIAWQFKRSRAVFLLVLISLSCWFITLFLPGMSSTGLQLRFAFELSALLLPINMFVLAFTEDRGVLTLWGFLTGTMLVLQAAVVGAMFLDGNSYHIVGLLQRLVATVDAFHPIPEQFFAWTILPQPVLFFTTAILLILILYLIWKPARRDTMHVSLITSCIAGIAAYHYVTDSTTSALFFSAAALIVTLSLFQDSYFMAYVDELTDLPSRRALNADFKKLGRKYALAMVDIDHFKKFNDTYGHDIGDDVLRMVAGHLSRISGGGTAYRYGGEEFTIVFPKGIASEVYSHLDDLRQKIATTDFHIRSGKRAPKKKVNSRKKSTVNVTISIGVADRNDTKQSPMDVVKQADKALYKAKGAGRNTVSIAKPPRNTRPQSKPRGEEKNSSSRRNVFKD